MQEARMAEREENIRKRKLKRRRLEDSDEEASAEFDSELSPSFKRGQTPYRNFESLQCSKTLLHLARKPRHGPRAASANVAKTVRGYNYFKDCKSSRGAPGASGLRRGRLGAHGRVQMF